MTRQFMVEIEQRPLPKDASDDWMAEAIWYAVSEHLRQGRQGEMRMPTSGLTVKEIK